MSAPHCLTWKQRKSSFTQRPSSQVTIFLSKFAPKVKPERSTKSFYYHGCDYLSKLIVTTLISNAIFIFQPQTIF